MGGGWGGGDSEGLLAVKEEREKKDSGRPGCGVLQASRRQRLQLLQPLGEDGVGGGARRD